MAGPMLGMAKSMGSAMFGMQVGQGLAALAAEVISAGDVGIPLTSDGHAALIPTNITTFGSGIDVPDSEIMVFVALREAAHQRLFTSVPWLRGRVQGAVEGYAVGIKVDPSRIEGAFGGIDPSNPEALQNALASGVFEQEDTAEQKAALLRLETLLALIEGWVDDVVDAAVSDRLPSAERLRETLRRRRAIGGPAEKTFATLVGLELRPRRLREAALFWQTLREDKGIEGRDAIWEHPDLLPNGEDLSDVPEFFSREKLMDFNASDFEDKPQQED
jgi:putative hydrolase